MDTYFLLAVGSWNLIGSIALYLMLNSTLADKILRDWTWIIAHPYDVGQYGSLWLWWAATTNTFFGAINIFAANWESTSQTIVIYGDLFVYGVLLLPAIVALKQEKYGYGKGHIVNVVLGFVWILWDIFVLI